MGLTMLVITFGMTGLIAVTCLAEFQKLWDEVVLSNTACLLGVVTIAAVIIEVIYGNARCKKREQNNEGND